MNRPSASVRSRRPMTARCYGTLSLVLWLGCSDDAADPYALPRADRRVQVTPIYRACNTDADCSIVGTGCDGCCQQDAIAVSLETTYLENFRAACANYRGGICDCDFVPGRASCANGQCTFIEQSDARTRTAVTQP